MCQYRIKIQQSHSNQDVLIEAENRTDAIEMARTNYFDYNNIEYDAIRESNTDVVMFS